MFLRVQGADRPATVRIKGMVTLPIQPTPPYAEALKGVTSGVIDLATAEALRGELPLNTETQSHNSIQFFLTPHFSSLVLPRTRQPNTPSPPPPRPAPLSPSPSAMAASVTISRAFSSFVAFRGPPRVIKKRASFAADQDKTPRPGRGLRWGES